MSRYVVLSEAEDESKFERIVALPKVSSARKQFRYAVGLKEDTVRVERTEGRSSGVLEFERLTLRFPQPASDDRSQAN